MKLDNKNPKIWGKYYWYVIHTIANQYPNNPTDNDKRDIKFIINEILPIILPCENCSNHFKLNLIKYLTLRNRDISG